MSIVRPSKSDIISAIWRDVESRTGYSGSRTEGIIPAVIESLGRQIDIYWAALENVDRQASVFTANGDGLDRLGQNLGVSRRLAEPATTFGSNASIKFTNTTGSQVNIPDGTRIWRKDTPQLAFIVSQGMILAAGETGFTHARADGVGESYNIPINWIDSHSLPVSGVNVTNVLGITSGTSLESDGSYRERLIRAFQSRYTFNADICSALLRGLPGVQDVYITEFTRGNGTFDAIVVPYNYSEVDSVVTVAQQQLNQVVPIGIDGVVYPPVFRTVDVSVALTFVPDAQNREAVRANIRDHITAFINAIPIKAESQGAELYVDQIYGIANNSDSSVISAAVSFIIDGYQEVNSGTIPLAFGEKFVPGVILVN